MKTDQYLTLCLEQATKSPLHYRHGCIVVCGGKVIGQGYNDYRPGFDGGALKHGRVAKGALHGPAIAELKEKLKKQKEKQQQSQQPEIKKPFIPFEGNGDGYHVNTTLSMHSEMMAIHSALSASSTLASTTASYEKPCFKLPRSDKRKARLRRDVLSAYVKAVCETSQRSGLSQVLYQYNRNNKEFKEDRQDAEDEKREEMVKCGLIEKSRAFHALLGGEKHHQKGKKKGKNGHLDEYGYQYDRYGRQIQRQQRRPSASKSHSSHLIRRYDGTDNHGVKAATTPLAAAPQHSQHEKDYKRSGKMKLRSIVEPPQPEPLLLPKGHTSKSTATVADRRKNARLNGADLYVARLGRCGDAITKPKRTRSASAVASANDLGPVDLNSADSDETLSQSTSSLPIINPATSGSLHDELIHREPPPSSTTTCYADTALNTSAVRASRPCYRCISYMHSAGIKRVFWTNDAGEWEGGKVRDLVDALDSSMESVANGGCGDKGGPMGNGVFVTKHEVLMLKRMMGPD